MVSRKSFERIMQKSRMAKMYDRQNQMSMRVSDPSTMRTINRWPYALRFTVPFVIISLATQLETLLQIDSQCL